MTFFQTLKRKLSSSSETDSDNFESTSQSVGVRSMSSPSNGIGMMNDFQRRHHGMSVLGGAALILADCMGTGILALPNDIRVVLDDTFGVIFVLINLPINLYAGYILSETAQFVEDGQTPGKDNDLELTQISSLDFDYDDESDDDDDEEEEKGTLQDRQQQTSTDDGESSKDYNSLSSEKPTKSSKKEVTKSTKTGHVLLSQNEDGTITIGSGTGAKATPTPPKNTADFIGLTGALFGNLSKMRLVVLLVFYANIFLVLGNYILVMAHAVRAFVGEDVIFCTYQAGIVASVLMYAISQLNTMAKLGKTATYVSLVALLIVVFLCIHAVDEDQEPPPASEIEPSVFRKMAALSSIAFAVGSQKLFLNVRYEMRHPHKAPISLGIALVVFGIAYIVVGQLAGPVPPSFLFDAIPYGTGARRIAAFFLWIHVAVSYAINSQALCASMERLAFCDINCCFTSSSTSRRRCPCPSSSNTAPITGRIRWMFLTLVTSISAFIVANAIPFFQDLIALIGAVTSVPLTFLIPAILYRKTRGVPIFCRSRPLRNRRRKSCRQRYTASFLLLLFSVAFFIVGLLGAISTIEVDWANHAPPFSCGP